MYEDKEYIVYIHENKTNGKVYVGITSHQNPEERWRKGNGYIGTYFYRAIKKYGWDGFTHEVLFSHISQDEAFRLEKKIISDLKANDRIHGYNIADGGQFPGEPALEALSRAQQQHRKKVVRLNDGKIYNSIAEAEADTGVANPLITKVCRKKRHTAGNMPNGEKIFWAYWKDGMDIQEELANRKKCKFLSGHYTSDSQKIVCLNSGKVYLSLSDAQADSGVYLENIIKCCEHKYNYSGRLSNGEPIKWLYYRDYIKLSKEEIELLKNSPIGRTRGHPIKCVEDSKVFYTIKDASVYYGASPVIIGQQLKGRLKNVYINNRTKTIHFVDYKGE